MEGSFARRVTNGVTRAISNSVYTDMTATAHKSSLVIVRNTSHQCAAEPNRTMSFTVQIRCGSMYTPPMYYGEDPCNFKVKMMDTMGCPVANLTSTGTFYPELTDYDEEAPAAGVPLTCEDESCRS